MQTLKLLIISALFLLLVYPCHSQIWAPQGAEWYFHYADGWGYPWTYYFMKVEGDTLVNDIQCRKISRLIRHYDGSKELLYPPLVTYYEDDIVYYLQNGQFYILYDFSAEVGDSWTSRNPYEYYGWPVEDDTMTTYTVDSVQYITIMGQTLKQLWVSSPNYWDFGIISQRIGSLGFMLPGEWLFWDPPVEGVLRCYTDDEFSYTPFYPCDSIITGVDDQLNITESYKLFPNPFYDKLTLETSKQISKVEISDVLGDCHSLFFTNVGGNTYNIDTHYLMPRFYIIILYSDNNQIIKFKTVKLATR